MQNSLLTVVIVSYNSFNTLQRCMGDWLIDPGCEIIIVDNASTDDSAQQIRASYPAIKLMAQSINLGYGRAANVALHEVKTKYALLLNPDMMARESDAVMLVETMMTLGERVAVLAPAVRERDFKRCGVVRQKWVIGAAMLFNMSALERTGFFDENIFLFSEETDLCRRINTLGLEINLDTDLYIRHLSKQSSTPSVEIEHMKNWHFAWSRMYFNRKYGLNVGRKKEWRVTLLYAIKFLVAGSASKRRAYQSRFAGALAFCLGKSAFLPDGRPQQSPPRAQG